MLNSVQSFRNDFGNNLINRGIRGTAEAGGDLALAGAVGVVANDNLLSAGPSRLTEAITNGADTVLDYTVRPVINGIKDLVGAAITEAIPPLEVMQYVPSMMAPLGALAQQLAGLLVSPEVLADALLLGELTILYSALKGVAKIFQLMGAQRTKIDRITGAITKGAAAGILGNEVLQYGLGNGSDILAKAPVSLEMVRENPWLLESDITQKIWASICGVGAAVTGALSALDGRKAIKGESLKDSELTHNPA